MNVSEVHQGLKRLRGETPSGRLWQRDEFGRWQDLNAASRAEPMPGPVMRPFGWRFK